MKHTMTADADPIDVDDYQARINDLRQCINNKQYYNAIAKVNAIIDHVKDNSLALLDIRSEAYALTAQYQKAERDAQQMIKKSPHQVEGYARQGDVYAMYGYQTRAIGAYNSGLQKDPTDTRLLAAIAEAIKQQNKCVDVIGALDQRIRDYKEPSRFSPAQLADKIISHLPRYTVAVGMELSRSWRNRILGCSPVWTDMTVMQDHHHRFINYQPSLHQIKSLTMDTSNQAVRMRYFKYICERAIPNIESLAMTANATCNLQQALRTGLCLALETMRNLTRINLDFDTNPMVLSLVDVLTACPHLTHLTYTIGSSLSLSAVDAYDAPTSKLTNLELRAPHIADTLIETVLNGCPDLQHLIVNGCGTSIFNLVAKHAPSLQVLGYNTYDETIPQHRMVNEPGLRVLYTKITNGTGMRASILLPFLYRHMATLENVCVHVASMKNEDVTEIPTKCPGFKLKNLRVFKLAAKKTTQRYLFEAIQHTGLEEFTISHVYDTGAMVEALKTLSLLHFSMGRIRSSNPNTRRLVSLFTDYAKKPMKSIDFCGSDAITDHVFQALGNVAALRQVAFSNLEQSTAQGIDGFFTKAQQLESVRLVSISAVTNNTLTVLGACQPLRTLYLDKIPAVTNDGVARLKRANGYLWVRISECPSIVTD